MRSALMTRTSLIATSVGFLALVIVGGGIWLTTPQGASPPQANPEPESPPEPKAKAQPRLHPSGGLKIDRSKSRTRMFGARQRAIQHLMPEPEGPIPDGPDLIFITWDTVRADHCSTYGYSRETTPTLTELGEAGLVFEEFIVPQATTLPSHVSMFTGTHPEEHGIIGNSLGSKRFVPPESLPTLAGHLGAQGYRTAGFVSSTPLKTHSGIHAGFQVWGEPRRRDRRAHWTTGTALKWLKQNPTDRPLFLWMHYYDPHMPYQSPEGTEALFNDDMTAWAEERVIAGIDEGVDAAGIQERLRSYDLEIQQTDVSTARLLEALKSRNREQIVVVVGDHGEGLGQHDHMEHGLLWHEQLHAPLVIQAPGVTPQRIKTLTAAKDILPILMNLGDFPDEKSLLAMTSGRDVLSDPEPTPVFARTSIRQTRTDLGRGGGYPTAWSLTTPTHTFMLDEKGRAQLYDRATDPHELTNVAANHPDLVSALSETVSKQRAIHAERHAAFGAGKTEEMSEELVNALEELGYIEP